MVSIALDGVGVNKKFGLLTEGRLPGKLASTFSFSLTVLWPIQVVVDVQPPENSTDTATWNGICFIAQNDCGSFIGSLTPDEREVKLGGRRRRGEL